jgi:hypothetical protein
MGWPAGARDRGLGQQPSPLENYRALKFPPKEENFDKGWQERVAAENDVINLAELGSLRAALKDQDPLVRSIAARARHPRGPAIGRCPGRLAQVRSGVHGSHPCG